MTDMPDHAKPPARRDHLWVLFIIAACCLVEVWASWVTIGAMSGFPKLFGKISTDWTLAVTTEAYWAYALYAWLGAAPGPKSRRFAMWSAAVVFCGSLTGQGAAHLVKPGTHPPAALILFVTDLPVIVLASIAILIHYRKADREEAAAVAEAKAAAERKAAIERAENDERAALRTRVGDLEGELSAVREALETAQREVADAVAKAETAARKLAAATARKGAGNSGRKQTRKPVPATGRKSPEATAPETADATADLDSEALVLKYLSEGKSASEAGRLAGLSDARGRQIARKLAKTAPTDAVDGDHEPNGLFHLEF